MKTKRAVTARIARSLQEFYPECADQFLCPTCLVRVPLARQTEISIAHILPRAAGGGLTTLLCRSCNSSFGARQDKWMGDYIRLFQAKNPSFLHAAQQRGYFEIGGVRVTGRYRVTPDGGIEFFVREDKTSPEALRALYEQFARAPTAGLSLTIPFPPVFFHKDLVTIGFVTAAYLLWFRELGYSWALQRHLDSVRDQIRASALLLPKSCSAASSTGSWEQPWIGMGEIAGELALLAGLGNRIVFLPPADRTDFYGRLPRDLDGVTIDKLRAIRFYENHTFEGPVAALYGNRLVVCPDVFFKNDHPVIFLPPDGSSPRMLYPIGKREFDEALQNPNAVRFTAGEGFLIPDNETGRPTKGGEQ